jgi:hypothetical protein
MVKIIDEQTSLKPPIIFNTKLAAFSEGSSAPTQLSIGDISVNYSLNILYSFL